MVIANFSLPIDVLGHREQRAQDVYGHVFLCVVVVRRVRGREVYVQIVAAVAEHSTRSGRVDERARNGGRRAKLRPTQSGPVDYVRGIAPGDDWRRLRYRVALAVATRVVVRAAGVGRPAGVVARLRGRGRP